MKKQCRNADEKFSFFCLIAVLKSQAKGFDDLEFLRTSVKIHQSSSEIMQLMLQIKTKLLMNFHDTF